VKALSIQQPWAWLICQGVKDIENREWTTDYRGFLLIHAGKQMDKNIDWARFTLEGVEMPPTKDYELGGIVGYATLAKVVTQSESPWFRGKYGFVLTQRRTVPFIPLRGQLGLFDVPGEIEAQINEIREQRFWDAEMKEQYQIAKEWEAYRHEGDESPPWRS
jgi:hypothetical protein